jgi:nicotinamidase-related amidase
MNSMQQHTRQTIVSAQRENRLAALHIDLQEDYIGGRTLSVSGTVRNFAHFLRALDVPNIWMAFANDPSILNKLPSKVATVDEFNHAASGTPCGLAAEVGALPEEKLIVKSTIDAFSPGASPIESHLKERTIDTLLVTGYTGTCCVARTMASAVRTNKFNVVAVQDCIDQASGWSYENFIRNLVDDPSIFQNRFHMASGFIPVLSELTRPPDPPSNDCNFPAPAL